MDAAGKRTTLDHTGPNAEQIKQWNETHGPKWVALHDLINTQIQPLGLHAMDRARIAAGEHALDIGCGCGDTTIELAGRVGTAGSATGVDVSAVMLARARETAAAGRVSNVHFETADAQTHVFAADSFDVAFSRFGVMFFAQPETAFANICSSLRPGGRLAFVAWQAVHLNPWMFVPMAAAAQHITIPLPATPDAPGPFAFADTDRVRGILSGAGFVDLAFEDITDTLLVAGGADLDQTVDFLLQMGPTGAAIREAATGVLPTVTSAIREALQPYATADGVRMPAAAWVVTGRRPT
jgi:ubiquinone/menaquinone biosynthesis C-methylase UbiE